MLEIDVQQLVNALLQGFQTAWESLGQPLVNSLITFMLNDPVGNVVLAVSLLSMMAGMVISAFAIRRRILNRWG